MTSYTSTIDDQQERHYIGNLLYDDDPFNPPSSGQFESNSAQQVPVGSVLPGGGPIGPSPNQTFWPEPPPPYSPYSSRSPQWVSINRQSAELFNTQLHNSFGQIPTFYSPPLYNRHRQWDGLGNGSAEGYPVLGSNLAYNPHAAFTHHMSGHYVTPDGFQHRANCYAAPFSSFNHSEVMQIDSPTHLTTNEYFKNENALITSDSLEPIPSGPASLIGTGACLPLAGKSYRDAASEKKRTNSSASATSTFSNLSSSGEAKVKYRGNQIPTPVIAKKNSLSSNKSASEKAKKEETLEKVMPAPNILKKTKSVPLRRVNENEFQKITRKKTKGSKAKKGEQVTASEDGLASQTVDASSRFDVLQLLSNQVNSSASRTSSVASTGPQSDLVTQKKSKSGRESNAHVLKPDASSRCSQQKSSCARNPFNRGNESIALTSKVSGLLQRAAFKKSVFGLRRDSGDRGVFDTPRFATRKQRGGNRKKNDVAFCLSCVFFGILSVIKGIFNWISDLVIDISLQSKDLALYLSFWGFVLGFRTYFSERFLKGDATKVTEWGLSENISLPSTGEEAMNRLLRCKEQDAYAILGLRADCTEEDIKHHYKKQAFLVHPDKNFSEGASEAFQLFSKAFEAVNTPEARRHYNLMCSNSPVHKELKDLWQRLHDKLEETNNSLPCDCGKRHRRVAIKNISPQQARYCRRCNLRHPAKHNDIWAESVFLGLFWTYYACLDGIIYDVSQWANCPRNNLRNLKANAHGVQYCMVSYACGTSTKRDASSKRTKKGHLQRIKPDDCDFPNNEYRYGMDDDFAYVASHGFNDLGNASQLASCRSFDRRLFNTDRSRRTGRKKKLH